MSEFIFRLPDSREVGRASSLEEFLERLKEVPIESLEYHFHNGHFAPWLRDNGYGRLVSMLNLIKRAHGESLRDKLVRLVENYLASTGNKKGRKSTGAGNRSCGKGRRRKRK